MVLRLQFATLLIPITVAAFTKLPPLSQRAEPLVTVEWLAQHLDDPNLVLLHVGERSEYDAGHIAGARYLTLDDVSKPRDRASTTELALELPAGAALRAKLESLGVSDDSRIVVAYGSGGVTLATRVIFTLDHFGLGERSALLDGGTRAWQAAGHSLTTAAPGARTGRLRELTPRHLTVGAEWLEAQTGKPGIAVVDGRARAYYDGVQAGSRGTKGHVRGAVSVPYSEITTELQRLRSRAELETMFRNAGVKPGDTVVAYCHIGQQATAVLFAARLLGHPVRLYDGSMQDWALRDRPLTTGGQ